jgi:hypothetical protein
MELLPALKKGQSPLSSTKDSPADSSRAVRSGQSTWNSWRERQPGREGGVCWDLEQRGCQEGGREEHMPGGLPGMLTSDLQGLRTLMAQGRVYAPWNPDFCPQKLQATSPSVTGALAPAQRRGNDPGGLPGSIPALCYSLSGWAVHLVENPTSLIYSPPMTTQGAPPCPSFRVQQKSLLPFYLLGHPTPVSMEGTPPTRQSKLCPVTSDFIHLPLNTHWNQLYQALP